MPKRFGHRVKLSRLAAKPNNPEFERPAGITGPNIPRRDLWSEALDARLAWLREQAKIRSQHGAVRVIMKDGVLCDPDGGTNV